MSPNQRSVSRRRVSLLAVAMCLLSLVSCTGDRLDQPDDTEPATRILVIGMDGLEWNIMLPLLKAGKLPAFASLMDRGSYGLLETIIPTESPVIWTSVATGKDRAKHGIATFMRPTAAGTPDELFNNTDRKTKAIWNIASDYEKRVAVVGWWMTYPVEAVNGVMVSQTNTAKSFRAKMQMPWKGLLKKGVSRQVHPESREDEMMNLLDEVEVSLDAQLETIFNRAPSELSPQTEKLWNIFLWAVRADVTYRKIILSLLNGDQPYDLSMVYFGGADVAGHRFWCYMQPELFANRPSPEHIEAFGKVIENYYIYLDSVAADLVKAAGENTRIIILSDHGMYASNRNAPYSDDNVTPPPSGEHLTAPPGVIIASGPDIPRQAAAKPIAELTRADLPSLGSIKDLTPTILALMRLPVGEDMDGRVVRRLIEPQFLSDHPTDRIVTHDTQQWFAARDNDAGQLGVPGQDERLRQLRSLGYLGGEDQPAPTDEEPADAEPADQPAGP